jgi:hypothetical protein
MWQDPIVNEARLLREQYAVRFNHDPNLIFQDIIKRQAQPEKKLVKYLARKPRTEALAV